MNNKIFFDEEYTKLLKDKFYFPDEGNLFLDNAGGALRLKKSVEAKAFFERYPDCPERSHPRALDLRSLVDDGTKQIIEIMFGAKGGALITELTASQTMFHMVEIILENAHGTNVVVSSLEHPSAFDAVEYYASKTGKELRVIPANKTSGGIDLDAVEALVDENTCLLSIMSASNASGVIMDIGEIVKIARRINPNIYIISDAVQHAPHCLMEAEALGVDGMNFGPYKFFGVRGCGFAWVSDRVAKLPHRKLILKPAETFALGTSTPANFAATVEIINYVCDIGAHFSSVTDRKALWEEGMKRIKLQEMALLHRLLEGSEDAPGLRHIKNVRVLLDTLPLEKRDLIISLDFKNISTGDAALEYQKNNITVCERLADSIYSKRILNALGIGDSLRISPLHIHGKADIDRFLKETERIANL